MGLSPSGTDGRRAGAAAALVIALASSNAAANLRAPRAEVALPSSVVNTVDPAPHLRVVHEDLTFRCHDRSCQVTATYSIDADSNVTTELVFVLPVEAPVTAAVGPGTVAARVTRLNGLPAGFAEHLDVRHEYDVPPATPLPPLYQAAARASFAPGRNQISFSYQQRLGAVELDHSYFHEGTMVPRLFYVLWPLREWTRAPGFTIALTIEMDREPPGWWKRTFGNPAKVSCHGFEGQQAQVGPRLVYTATLSDDFPDYLRCSVGP
jgi:hypothetical protein